MDVELSGVLPGSVFNRLSDNGIKFCKHFLSRNPLELMKYTGSSYSTVNQYITDVSNQVAPKPETAYEMYCAAHGNGERFFPTCLQKLDTLLQGGIPAGCITEIAGPPATGKTQLCLQLSVMATSHGGVIYIDTEGAFTAQRLVEIATTRFAEKYKDSSSISHMAENIHVYNEMTCKDLMKRLNKLNQLVHTLKIKLVVVDSVASLVRKEFDTRQTDGNARRAALLCKQATILKCIAELHGIPVVVTNQITGIVSHDDDESEHSELDNDCTFTAALGNTWSHCVNTRLLMMPDSGDKHILTIAKSPLAPYYQMAYHIETKGLVMDWTGTAELAVHNATQEQMVLI